MVMVADMLLPLVDRGVRVFPFIVHTVIRSHFHHLARHALDQDGASSAGSESTPVSCPAISMVICPTESGIAGVKGAPIGRT